MRGGEHKIFTFGDFRLDATDRLLFRARDVVPLAPRSLDALVMLVENRGRVLLKEELMSGVWADAFVEENNLNQAISALRKALGERSYIETIPKRGYRFVADVGEEDEAAAPAPESGTLFPQPLEDAASARLEPVGGAIPLDSRFYVVRDVDETFQTAIARRDSIVLVKGARQMGKTSLLARGLQNARRAGGRVVLTDFQDLGAADLESAEALFVTLGKAIAEELDLDASIKSVWDPDDSPNTNFARYMRREVLKGEKPLVWGLDEVDRLFSTGFANEVFGLFRAWHNKRALDPSGPWHRLTLAMAYATEAHLFITDINQSPFNVGTRLALDDFTAGQVMELNRRYGEPLPSAGEVERFYGLVGGQPYLVRQGLHALTQAPGFAEFLDRAHRDDGPFGDHLRRIVVLLGRDGALGEAVRCVLEERQCPSEDAFYRLRSAGILSGDTAHEARLRCELYATYLSRHMP